MTICGYWFWFLFLSPSPGKIRLRFKFLRWRDFTPYRCTTVTPFKRSTACNSIQSIPQQFFRRLSRTFFDRTFYHLLGRGYFGSCRRSPCLPYHQICDLQNASCSCSKRRQTKPWKNKVKLIDWGHLPVTGYSLYFLISHLMVKFCIVKLYVWHFL